MSTLLHSSPAESLHIQYTTKCQPFCILHQLSHYIYNIPQNVNPFAFFTSWVTTYTTESLHIQHTTKCQPFCILHQLSHYIYNIPQNVNPFASVTSWVYIYTTYHKMSTLLQSSPAESLHIQYTTKCQPFCILHQLSHYIYIIPQNINPLHSSPAESLHIQYTTKCQPFCILHQLSHYIYNIPQNVNPFAFFTSWVTTYTTYHKMSTLLHSASECRQTLAVFDVSAISKQIKCHK